MESEYSFISVCIVLTYQETLGLAAEYNLDTQFGVQKNKQARNRDLDIISNS